MIRSVGAVLAALCIGLELVLFAQDTRFDVASVKARTGAPYTGASPHAPGEFNRPDITLRALIRFAYDVQGFQIGDDPGWVSSARFEVRAKLPAGEAGAPKMRLAVQHLLQDRFALKTRWEAREQPEFALKTRRDDASLGPQLRLSAVDCLAFHLGRKPLSESPRDTNGQALCGTAIGVEGSKVTLTYHGIPMSQFVKYLMSYMGRHVVDRTGLAGNYDIDLTFSVSQLPSLPFYVPDGSEDIAISTALQEQLGLTVESGRGPVDVLVIESVAAPTPN